MDNREFLYLGSRKFCQHYSKSTGRVSSVYGGGASEGTRQVSRPIDPNAPGVLIVDDSKLI